MTFTVYKYRKATARSIESKQAGMCLTVRCADTVTDADKDLGFRVRYGRARYSMHGIAARAGILTEIRVEGRIVFP